ncbi:MAG: polymerase sigma-70 factor, subfamily [Acidobacteriota bacterium]|jgi:RNA polymerase sigma-70 factor (ECF subfamily)|nr:polymerase sigma-70 factor, subfamily [Acidobacteriota bacterium]
MTEEFETYRALLFSIAYRMLGSVADAEDVVQDAFVRFAGVDRDAVRDAKSFLATIATRLALDKLKSAQATREEYIGPWLPEPLFTGDDPEHRVERAEAVSYALLVALERLTPAERAVFVLAEAFDFDHAEIADTLELNVAASRQLLHRAREKMADEKRRFEPSREEQLRLIGGFLEAVQSGDVARVSALLAHDVVAVSDGGGRVNAARNVVRGVDHVSRLLIGLASKARADFRVTVEELNGVPTIVTWFGEEIQGVVALTAEDGKLVEIDLVLNPQKLKLTFQI